MTPVDIDKLKELLSRATPGPWVAIEAISMKYCSAVEYRSDVPGLSQTVCQVREDGPLVGASRLSEQNANACLIAEMRNALPALIAKAERVDALEAALRKHGKHDGLCARIGGYGYCSCGLEAELDALSPKPEISDPTKRMEKILGAPFTLKDTHAS